MKLVRVTRERLPEYQERLEALEGLAVYPLGQDAFRLSHGPDYLRFFERLGEVRYHVLEDGDRIAAAGCGVLRAGPKRWYGSDLKVHPDYRGRHLPIRMGRELFLPAIAECSIGYGVAMDPPDGRVPPAIRMLAHFERLSLARVALTKLLIYSAEEAEMRAALPIAAAGREGAHFVSLAGIKDLILESTKRALALLHLRFGARTDAVSFSEPQPGHTHMWCLPAEHAAASALRAAGFAPSATATIVHRGLAAYDWSRIDTSEI